MEGLSFEEQMAASAIEALGASKRGRDSPDDAAGGMNKRGRVEEPAQPVAAAMPVAAAAAEAPTEQAPPPQPSAELKPYPFFYYEDHSKEEDPDSLTPLTPPGRVPNFPAKMHSILSRPDLADIICWMPHGRSWRVLKPREFEIRVIPTYFEHAKFSSFIRQANGWGFRRITQGRDRNSYYHPLFLRGLPHLCKKMKRPGVAEKVAADPEHEPDFYKISEMHPVPEKADDDTILLQCTLQGGPKARMPIYSGVLSLTKLAGLSSSTATSEPTSATTSTLVSSLPQLLPPPSTKTAADLTPRDQSSLASFQQALGASESQFKGLAVNSPKESSSLPLHIPTPSYVPTSSTQFTFPLGGAKVNPLVAANQLAFASSPLPNVNNMAAAQFAAGFAAATVLNQQQLRNMLGSFSFVPSSQPAPTSQPPASAVHNFSSFFNAAQK